MGGETDNLPTRRRTNSGLVGSSAVISPKKEDTPYSKKPTLMRCRYYYVGCHEMIESDKYAQHLEDYRHDHLRQLEATVALQSKKISQLEASQSAPAGAVQLLEELTRVRAPQPPDAKDYLNAIADLLEKQGSAFFSSTREFLAPKAEDLDTPGLKTWQILHLFVLSFVFFCYLSLAGMGRMWGVLQLVPLVTYCSLMTLHWWNALLFSSAANTVISLGVVCLWGSISLFLPVF
jgi:hypothetical protein